MIRTYARRIAVAAAFTAFAAAGLAAMPAPSRACRPADPGDFSMTVLVDGRPLAEYLHDGARYVEARKGREYSVRLRNGTGRRVAVALAVDGLNSIDAKHTSAREARKWILGPWETIELTGWQTGDSTARRFVFTSEPDSYGAWLGRTKDLGVISAAFFREVDRTAMLDAPMMPPEPMAKAAGAAEPQLDRSDSARRQKDELAATGIGREVEHRVVRVDFDGEDTPAATVDVRYEYHDALVRLGVLPATDEPLARRERAHGFADDGFAPDPYRRDR